MKISDYLKNRSQELSDSHRRIRDYRVFDFNYVPEQPLMRAEAKAIIDAALRYSSSGIANHLFVFGTRGSGKTLLVRYIASLLQQQHGVRYLYANCRQHNSSYKILAHLLGVRPRGCGLDELWMRFCDQHPGKLILILDEVDLLSEKDKTKDIFYLISRSGQSYMAILLSNNPRFLVSLDESIRSSLQPELVHFKNYDALQILQILKDRAQAGLGEASEALLGRIAALTTSATNSDVRVAIKTLYYAALEEADQVEAVFHRARRDLTHDVLSDLSAMNLLILKAAIETADPMVKAVYHRYRQLSAVQHIEPFSYVYFYSNLSYLQSIGLILLMSTKQGRTYTNRIQLLFEPSSLQAIYDARLG